MLDFYLENYEMGKIELKGQIQKIYFKMQKYNETKSTKNSGNSKTIVHQFFNILKIVTSLFS